MIRGHVDLANSVTADKPSVGACYDGGSQQAFDDCTDDWIVVEHDHDVPMEADEGEIGPQSSSSDGNPTSNTLHKVNGHRVHSSTTRAPLVLSSVDRKAAEHSLSGKNLRETLFLSPADDSFWPSANIECTSASTIDAWRTPRETSEKQASGSFENPVAGAMRQELIQKCQEAEHYARLAWERETDAVTAAILTDDPAATARHAALEEDAWVSWQRARCALAKSKSKV